MGDHSGGGMQMPSQFADSRELFHGQFDLGSGEQRSPKPDGERYDQRAFNMGALANALSGGGQQPADSRQTPMEMQAQMSMMNPASVYQMIQASQYQSRLGQFQDPSFEGRPQQHQYHPQMYGAQQGFVPPMQRRQPLPLHAMTHIGYGMNQPQCSPLENRFSPPQAGAGFPEGLHYDWTNSSRRGSEPGTIPSFPRGPPRKPKQSGNALWVGNLPPAATVTDLKDHFSRDATKDIESLFLIAKSNCAFVNYRSEAACLAAMNRFHDSRFHGVRLVCRLRRGSVSSTATATVPEVLEACPPMPASRAELQAVGVDHGNPMIVGSEFTSQAAEQTGSSSQSARVPEKFFIVKSLTLQDLEASVRNGVWATQAHNEAALNKAHRDAENVYLIFSANKSGEYFGYARMTSPISGNSTRIDSSASNAAPPAPTDGPRSIPTPATEFAPRGRIIDDLARGTIFWEAEKTDDEGDSSPEKEPSSMGLGEEWGRPFHIEWLSTARLPFYRTRGLRNPWNANREVKIARDGTELEPSVGRRLITMFHRPPQPPNMVPMMMPNAGMAYQVQPS